VSWYLYWKERKRKNRYSTAFRTMTSTVLLKRAKNDGIAVYVPKETIFKEMAAKIKLRQHFVFDLVRELSDIPRTMLCSPVKSADVSEEHIASILMVEE
jgi:hypothetical protein